MKLYKVGILGATGAVGREMMKILAERQFPISELRLFASSRSAGKVVEWNGRPVMIQEPSEENFRGLDIVLGAAESDIARLYAPEVVRAGAVFVDNSSAYRMDDDVPLVIPEVNPEDVKLHHGIIASANCSTIITVTAVNALNAISPIRSMVASTYQAVSGAGAGGPVELAEEVEALRTGKPVQPKVFSHQIAYNLIPQIGGEQYEGYTSEEMKMQNEGRKIMHLPDLRVTCTCVRVPVVRSHSISVTLRFDKPVSVREARHAIAAAPGCRLVDDLGNHEYPMPLDTSDQDLVYVGRIRPDLTDDNGLTLWCCGDQIRKRCDEYHSGCGASDRKISDNERKLVPAAQLPGHFISICRVSGRGGPSLSARRGRARAACRARARRRCRFPARRGRASGRAGR